MEQSVDLDEADPRSYIRLVARIRNQILSGELELGGARSVHNHAQPGAQARAADLCKGVAAARRVRRYERRNSAVSGPVP
jgi:hypothetical protein